MQNHGEEDGPERIALLLSCGSLRPRTADWRERNNKIRSKQKAAGCDDGLQKCLCSKGRFEVQEQSPLVLWIDWFILIQLCYEDLLELEEQKKQAKERQEETVEQEGLTNEVLEEAFIPSFRRAIVGSITKWHHIDWLSSRIHWLWYIVPYTWTSARQRRGLRNSCQNLHQKHSAAASTNTRRPINCNCCRPSFSSISFEND